MRMKSVSRGTFGGSATSVCSLQKIQEIAKKKSKQQPQRVDHTHQLPHTQLTDARRLLFNRKKQIIKFMTHHDEDAEYAYCDFVANNCDTERARLLYVLVQVHIMIPTRINAYIDMCC